MVTDTETNCVYFSDLLPDRYPELFRQLDEILEQAGVCLELIPDTRDIWCRDYMPIQVAPGRFVQFRYAPNYLRDREGAGSLTPPEVARNLPEIEECEQSDIVLDGGNVVRWPDQAIVTDKIYKENPAKDRADLRAELARLLAVKRLLVIPKEPGEPLGHADGVVRFVNGKTIVINDYSQSDPAYREQLRRVFVVAALNCIEVPYVPQPAKTRDIASAVGVYVNFLQVGELVICPSYGIPQDGVALALLSGAFNDSRVVSVDCRKLAAEGGVLNCVSWNILA
jgi:agmatine/peptidylarginine deiminase